MLSNITFELPNFDNFNSYALSYLDYVNDQLAFHFGRLEIFIQVK